MTNVFQSDDQDILARTIWGECRSGGEEGMTSVANVIINRANAPSWWGYSIQSVCLKPMQFSCWNNNDPNRALLTTVTSDDPQFATAMSISAQGVAGNLTDITNGACYYYAESMKTVPSWAEGKTPCATIAGQIFFNNIT